MKSLTPVIIKHYTGKPLHMENYRLRAYNASDAQAVVDVINAAAMTTVKFPRAVVDAVVNL